MIRLSVGLKRVAVVATFAVCSLAGSSGHAAEERTYYKPYGKLFVLDRAANHSDTHLVRTEGLTDFFDLEVYLKACWRRQDDSRALVVVRERDRIVFSGWIFSEDSYVSGLEHPIYYLKLIECGNG